MILAIAWQHYQKEVMEENQVSLLLVNQCDYYQGTREIATFKTDGSW